MLAPLHRGGLYINAGRKLMPGTPSLFSTYQFLSFYSNRAMIGGGAYLSENDYVYLQNVEFVSNVAMSGGGLAIYSAQAYHHIGYNATFTNNVAVADPTFNPGAPQLTITRGGRAQATSVADRQGCGVGGGGAICLQLGPARVVLANMTLIGNRAVSGGGVSAEKDYGLAAVPMLGDRGCW